MNVHDLLLLHHSNLIASSVKMPDYLESQGNDYILTDIYPSSQFSKVEYKVTMNERNTTKAYFGGRSSTNVSAIVLWQVSGKIRKDWGSKSTSGSTVTQGATYEDSITSNGQSFTSNSPLALFACNQSGGADDRMGKGRIYYVRFYDTSGNLVHNLIPWLVGDKPCIRDKVTGKIYYSVYNQITSGYD